MSEEKNGNMFSNAKLSTIFMVVLGLHVVVIVLISAYHLLKGDTSGEMAQRMSPPEPRSYESILMNEADELTPEVVTAYDNSELVSESTQVEQPSLPMSMPAADDPIWTGQAPVTSIVTPAADPTGHAVSDVEKSTQDMVTESTGFRPAPMVVESVKPVKPEVTQTVTRAASVVGTKYTVKKGDTLSGIASRHDMKVTAIQEANKLDSSMIRIGQTLLLPGVSAVAVANTTTMMKSEKPAPRATVVNTGTYTVSKGDTLWRISQKFSTTPQAIAAMNGITDPSKLRIGDTLKVPNRSTSAATAPVESSTDMAMMPTR